MIAIHDTSTCKVFTIEEANQLLPLITKITEEYSKKVKQLTNRVNQQNQLTKEAEESINLLIGQWQNKLEKLGVKPKGLWLADFDSGFGCYCWKYPEVKIQFYHEYNQSFSGRKRLDTQEGITVG